MGRLPILIEAMSKDMTADMKGSLQHKTNHMIRWNMMACKITTFFVANLVWVMWYVLWSNEDMQTFNAFPYLDSHTCHEEMADK